MASSSTGPLYARGKAARSLWIGRRIGDHEVIRTVTTAERPSGELEKCVCTDIVSRLKVFVTKLTGQTILVCLV